MSHASLALLILCQIAVAQQALPGNPEESRLADDSKEGSPDAAHKRLEAQHILGSALGAEGEDRPALLAAAARKAARLLEPDSLHSERLRAALETRAGLMAAVQAVHADLIFSPTVEAGTPPGFPSPTAVGCIEIKSYPSHRLVRTPMSGLAGNQGAFFRLFNHIKKNDIAMTAPVPVEHGPDGSVTMSFLYGDVQAGPLGADGKVQVVDIEPITVVSIGLRGREATSSRQEALKALEAWLNRNAATWERAGGWRTMGWNSPFVPSSRRYWEVQIPIRPRVAASPASAS